MLLSWCNVKTCSAFWWGCAYVKSVPLRLILLNNNFDKYTSHGFPNEKNYSNNVKQSLHDE